MAVHCFPFMVLLTMQESYGSASNPSSSIRKLLKFSQNSRDACRVPNRALRRWTYSTGLPHSWVMKGPYLSWSTRTNSLAIGPLSFTKISSSMLQCMNAPGMSTVITLCLSWASMAAVRKRASIDTVNELVSSFVLYTRCFCLLAHPLALILPHHFSFRYIRYLSASRFCC